MTLRIQGDSTDVHSLFAGELHLNDVASGAQNRLTFTKAPSNTDVLSWGGGSTGEVVPDLVEILIDDPRVNVLIWPRTSTFTAGGVQLCDTGVIVDDGYMAPGFVLVLYDYTDCDGHGYVGYDPSGGEIPMPPSALLMYGLAAAATYSPDAWTIIGKTMPTAPVVNTAGCLMLENIFRAGKLMPKRDGPTDVYGRTCSVKSHRRVTKPAPTKTTVHYYTIPKCFVATAAYGSPFASEVEFLRDVRDQVVRQTRAGDAFFRHFHEHYYRVSPQIAAAALEDPELARLLRIAIVEPLVLWLRSAVGLPDASLDGVPEPWRAYLADLRSSAEQWAQQIGLPESFDGLDPFDAVTELAMVLRFMLREPAGRAAYIEELRAAGELPLPVSAGRREEAMDLLVASGRTDREIEAVLGVPS
jgi:hypothetical protein